MRGFRASRAVHNHKTARFGRQLHGQNEGANSGFNGGNGTNVPNNVIPFNLPDWLKMPKASTKVAKKVKSTRSGVETKRSTGAARAVKRKAA